MSTEHVTEHVTEQAHADEHTVNLTGDHEHGLSDKGYIVIALIRRRSPEPKCR